MRIYPVRVLSDGSEPGARIQLDQDLDDVLAAARGVMWPQGGEDFALNPTVGANGTPIIKGDFIKELLRRGWRAESPVFKSLKSVTGAGPGPVDAATQNEPRVRTIVEWETGNVSSSHRALNKIVLAFKYRLAAQGIWVVPTRAMYRFLTGRTGNLEEVEPYFPVFDRPDLLGRLIVVPVQHDRLDVSVPVIAKMTYKGNLPALVEAELETLSIEDSKPS